MSSINFDNAYLLLIALPLVVLFSVPFALAIRKDNVNGHNIASQVMHVVIALLVGFAAAGTNYTTVLTETAVYVVADVSYSAHRNLDTVDNYIKGLSLPGNAQMGVVCFGKDSELLYELGDPEGFETVKDYTVDDSETNIAEALEYAGTLFEPDVIKRIVLITDARQTDERDSYAVRRAVTQLQMQNVTVDAIFMDDALQADTPEVQISSVDYTRTAFLGHDESAHITLQTNYAVHAFIDVKSGDWSTRVPANLTEGLNDVPVSLPTEGAGTFDYTVTVEADGDTSKYNNVYNFTQVVSGDIRVLFITEKWTDAVQATELYENAAFLDIYECDESVKLTEKQSFKATLPESVSLHLRYGENDAPVTEVPYTIEDLCRYDEIVLADMDVRNLKNDTEFMNNVDISVSMFGKSMITVGDVKAQDSSATEDELRRLQNMLPVRYGSGNNDPKLYTIVIDSSSSMGQLNHMNIAKDLTRQLVGLLQDNDEVCLITFSGDARMLQAPTNLMNRDSVLQKIDALDRTQGTFIGAGLEMAYEVTADLPYSDKQLMLITDGLSFTDEESDPPSIASRMYDAGIVTSVFDVGRQGDRDGENPSATASAAKAMLESVAGNGHGNYYYFSNAEEITDVMFGEMKDRLTDVIVEETTSVSVARRTDDILEGIDTESPLPDINGYIYGYTKASATTVLNVDHIRGGIVAPGPLYAYWNYGNGRVSSFTSSFSGNWINDWKEAGLTDVFFSNMLVESTPDEKTDYPYAFNLLREGNVSRIELVPPVIHPRAVAEVLITFPDGSVTENMLTFDASYYYFEFIAKDMGKYRIDVTYSYLNKEYTSTQFVNLSYPSEYDAFATYDSAVLHKAIDNQGTVVENDMLSIENDERQLSTYVIQLTVPLLIICAVLFVADIVVRKLKWEDIRSFFGFGHRTPQKHSEVKKS